MPTVTQIIPSDAATNTKEAETLTIKGVALAGQVGGDFEDVDVLGKLLDSQGDLSLNVRQLNPPKQDASGALVQSDVQIVTWYGGSTVGPSPLIDTTGYQSIVIQFSGSNGSFNLQSSSDPALFTSGLQNVNAWSSSGVIQTAAITGSTGATFVAPVLGRWFRLYCSAAGTVGPITITLRSAPLPFMPVNALSVSGPVLPGNASSGNPLLLGATDPAGLARRLVSDTNGVLEMGGVLKAGFQIGIYNAQYGGYTQTINSQTAALSTFNPVLTAGVDGSGAVRVPTVDVQGRTVVKMAASDQADQSVSELLLQMAAAQRATVHLLTQLVAISRGQVDPAPSDEADALIGEYLSATNTFTNLTN